MSEGRLEALREEIAVEVGKRKEAEHDRDAARGALREFVASVRAAGGFDASKSLEDQVRELRAGAADMAEGERAPRTSDHIEVFHDLADWCARGRNHPLSVRCAPRAAAPSPGPKPEPNKDCLGTYRVQCSTCEVTSSLIENTTTLPPGWSTSVLRNVTSFVCPSCTPGLLDAHEIPGVGVGLRAAASSGKRAETPIEREARASAALDGETQCCHDWSAGPLCRMCKKPQADAVLGEACPGGAERAADDT